VWAGVRRSFGYINHVLYFYYATYIQLNVENFKICSNFGCGHFVDLLPVVVASIIMSCRFQLNVLVRDILQFNVIIKSKADEGKCQC
jgi:hypothetical protein